MESNRAQVAIQLLESLQLQEGGSSLRAVSRGVSCMSLASQSGGHQAMDATRTLGLVGELLMQSHAGYTRCGIGAVGTDCLVRLARECMRDDEREEVSRVFGARITGGGCGGCVCIATNSGGEGESAVHSIAKKYKTETRHQPTIIGGSSTGAIWLDHTLVRIKKVQNRT